MPRHAVVCSSVAVRSCVLLFVVCVCRCLLSRRLICSSCLAINNTGVDVYLLLLRRFLTLDWPQYQALKVIEIVKILFPTWKVLGNGFGPWKFSNWCKMFCRMCVLLTATMLFHIKKEWTKRPIAKTAQTKVQNGLYQPKQPIVYTKTAPTDV